jgi:OOP family OmpA-OmpF porin
VFDANVLFDANKSSLRAAGRDTLDTFVGKIRGLEPQSVMAIGYADRMGPADANQILSEERVATVKAYLVSRGVAAERVKTRGWDDMRPTRYHVFIEISGSRLAQ